MKLSMNFSELQNIISESSIILTDKSVDNRMKNLIFMTDSKGTRIVFYNPFTFARVKTETVTVSDMPDGQDKWVFQVRLNDIQKVISSYNNLNRTEVEGIDFIDAKNKIKIVIHEKAKDVEKFSFLSRDSVNNLDSIPVISSVIDEVSVDLPDQMEDFRGEVLKTYLDAIIPLQTNDGKGVSSRINFAGEYVFLISNFMSIFYKNILGDSFKDLALGYSSCAYLRKLCDVDDETVLKVKKLSKSLCVTNGRIDTYMRWQNIKIKYDMYVDNMKRDKSILLDRLYLKDVLKRLTIVNEGVFSINADNKTVMIETSAFTQEIPIENMKGDINNIKFRINGQSFAKLIAGDDSNYPDKVVIYFVENNTGNGYSIYMRDETTSWFTFMVVR